MCNEASKFVVMLINNGQHTLIIYTILCNMSVFHIYCISAEPENSEMIISDIKRLQFILCVLCVWVALLLHTYANWRECTVL